MTLRQGRYTGLILSLLALSVVPSWAAQPQTVTLSWQVISPANHTVRLEYQFIGASGSGIWQTQAFVQGAAITNIRQYNPGCSGGICGIMTDDVKLPDQAQAVSTATSTTLYMYTSMNIVLTASGTYNWQVRLWTGSSTFYDYFQTINVNWGTTNSQCPQGTQWDVQQQACVFPSGSGTTTSGTQTVVLSNPNYDPGASWYSSMLAFFQQFWTNLQGAFVPDQTHIDAVSNAWTGFRDLPPFSWLSVFKTRLNAPTNVTTYGLRYQTNWTIGAANGGSGYLTAHNAPLDFDPISIWTGMGGLAGMNGCRLILLYIMYIGYVIGVMNHFMPKPSV